MDNLTDDFLPTRSSLLKRIKDHKDERSWQDFFQTYRSLIHGVARKAGLTDDEAKEVVQETLISLSQKIGEFCYDKSLGSFKSWLLTTARWRIGDQFRRRGPAWAANQRHASDESSSEVVAKLPDPKGFDLESVWEQEWTNHILRLAAERVRPQTDPAQYQIYDLYVLREWPALKVAQELKVSVQSVYLAKHRVGRIYAKELKKLRAELGE